MDLHNTTYTSIQANCTVDTSYRFTYYKISYSVIFIFGVVSNATALRHFCRMPRTFTSTAVYMANLAAADIFFVISLPLRIYYYHNKAGTSNRTSDWSPGVTFCQMTFTLKYISLYGGIFFLVCIGVDRYFAVVNPLLQHLRKVRTARMLSAGIWCLVLALSLALPFLHSAASRRHKSCLMDPSSKRHSTIILAALSLVQMAYLLPALLLLFSYCSILRVLRRLPHRRKIRHRRTLTVIYWVLVVFFLCFTPYHLNLLGYTLTQVGIVHSCGLAQVTKALHPIVLSLASTNCCLNPLIYYFSSSLVHKEPTGSRGSASQ
ncbi:lysophosphatidic acid receptor 6-like [Rhinichthys klamathensis goyatoka]|uniref:lysophosphatidic acid receptor 6-like n=1 Tax=Rhinichthys klamathensis goyatoka TaxID=3034132 RepID=UPI0024B49641|nr:lysophosphatidic acid receptor 6-like [Rhinichthys klamathensis goyatoka]